MNEQEIVHLIAGTINATGKTLYWKDENNITSIGEYYIVKNMNGYDLVKAIARVEILKENVSKLTNTKYENMKKVICGVSKERIEN